MGPYMPYIYVQPSIEVTSTLNQQMTWGRRSDHLQPEATRSFLMDSSAHQGPGPRQRPCRKPVVWGPQMVPGWLGNYVNDEKLSPRFCNESLPKAETEVPTKRGKRNHLPKYFKAKLKNSSLKPWPRTQCSPSFAPWAAPRIRNDPSPQNILESHMQGINHSPWTNPWNPAFQRGMTVSTASLWGWHASTPCCLEQLIGRSVLLRIPVSTHFTQGFLG